MGHLNYKRGQKNSSEKLWYHTELTRKNRVFVQHKFFLNSARSSCHLLSVTFFPFDMSRKSQSNRETANQHLKLSTEDQKSQSNEGFLITEKEKSFHLMDQSSGVKVKPNK